jgi:hypothetical protein
MNTLLFPKMVTARALVFVLFFSLTQAVLFGSTYPNGGFEESKPSRDLGAGVDSTGFATINTATGEVPAAKGGFADENLAFSVSVADLNADDLIDIAAMDGFGVLRIYFNSGSKTEPKFTHAETTSYNLYPAPMPTKASALESLDPEFEAYNLALYYKKGQRISLFNDGNLGSKYNLLVTTSQGRMFYFPNSGTVKIPDFKAPDKIEETPIKAGSFPYLAQALSPFVGDWNKDSKIDVIYGEGSYSANSIFILLNKSSAISKFEDKDRYLLASGMGLEQLSPCVVDYNGDGQPDLLVTERGGRIAVYLSPATPWQPGDTIPFHTFLTKNGAPPQGVPPIDDKKPRDPFDIYKATNLLNTGGISTIATGDFNGDNLFDIVLGKDNGRISIAMNTGTATEPKFAALSDLKLETTSTAIAKPTNWELKIGEFSGNFGAFAGVVKADAIPGIQPVEGSSFLHLGYTDKKNTILSPPVYRLGKTNTENLAFAPGAFVIEGPTPFKAGKKYSFSFSARGNRVKKAKIQLEARFSGGGTMTQTVVETKRGTVTASKKKGLEVVTLNLLEPFTVTDKWQKFTTKEAVYDDPITEALMDKSPRFGALVISVTLEPGAGDFSIDDFQMIEK